MQNSNKMDKFKGYEGLNRIRIFLFKYISGCIPIKDSFRAMNDCISKIFVKFLITFCVKHPRKNISKMQMKHGGMRGN